MNAEVKRSSVRLDERSREKSRLQEAFMKNFETLVGGQTYAEFGNKLGVAPAVVWNYLHGNRMPDVTALDNIATCCGVSVDWLIGRDQEGAGY